MALLIYSTLTFAVAIIVFAWRGLDATFIVNHPDTAADWESPGLRHAFGFMGGTKVVVTGLGGVLVALVGVSFVYFWHVSLLDSLFFLFFSIAESDCSVGMDAAEEETSSSIWYQWELMKSSIDTCMLLYSIGSL